MAPKRDSSGNVIQKGVPPQKPAVMVATSSLAAHSTEPENKKFKDNKTPKRKKFIRAAGGQVWEDESLAEWNPG